MKTVKIYIETTITGPAAPKRGGYAAALTFTRRNGDIEDRFLKGEEEGTTYNRSVLLAMIYALQKLKEPCRVVFYTRNTYIKNMIQADNPEKWRRAEWKKSDGKGIQNQDLWKMFLEESTEHEIEIMGAVKGIDTSKAKEMYSEIISAGDCCNLKSLAINGNDLTELGIDHGKEVGEYLAKALDFVLKNPHNNQREKIMAFLRG